MKNKIVISTRQTRVEVDSQVKEIMPLFPEQEQLWVAQYLGSCGELPRDFLVFA